MVNSPGHMNHHSPQRFGQPHHLINSPRMNSAKTPTQLETGKQSNGFGRVPVDIGVLFRLPESEEMPRPIWPRRTESVV